MAWNINYRPCSVDGKNGIFHGFVSDRTGYTWGLVEFSSGFVQKIGLNNIKFLDTRGLFTEYERRLIDEKSIKTMIKIEIFWDDLTVEKQHEIEKVIGNEHIPLTILEFEKGDKETNSEAADNA